MCLLVQTHRDPEEFMGAWCSLLEATRSLVAEPGPRPVLGQEQLAFMAGMLGKSNPAVEAQQRAWLEEQKVQ